MYREFWQGLDRRRRFGFVAAAFAIVAATVALAAWLLRTDYDVLFANLAPPDAAAMTAELERMKQPFRLGGNGATILVDREAVPATRLKLMGKEMPLHGAVGFELFNNSDFGMTEFAQKINYQRALQGELTRTILSLAEVESARVHLAFAEEGLWKRDPAKAKAAITLGLRRGETLRPEQVSGIQRLVAAAVNGISPHDVTIVSRQGVALTRGSAVDDAAALPARLELKTEIEQALAKKVARVLERLYGEGQVLASVDVALDMNQVRVTTEDVRGQAGAAGETPTGVIVRERETVRDEPAGAGLARDGAGGSSFRETDYQVGRRIEQVITQPGTIRKLQVVAVVKATLDGEQLAQVRSLVGAAVGAVAERGDTVVVQAIGVRPAAEPNAATEAAAPIVDEVESARAADAAAAARGRAAPTVDDPMLLLGLAAVMAIGAMAWLFQRARRPLRAEAGSVAVMLTDLEREAALVRLREWLAQPPGAVAAAVPRESS